MNQGKFPLIFISIIQKINKIEAPKHIKKLVALESKHLHFEAL